MNLPGVLEAVSLKQVASSLSPVETYSRAVPVDVIHGKHGTEPHGIAPDDTPGREPHGIAPDAPGTVPDGGVLEYKVAALEEEIGILMDGMVLLAAGV